MGEVTKPEGMKGMVAQDRASVPCLVMNCCLWRAISVNNTDHVNILQMGDMMFSQLCIRAPKLFVANMSTPALYWPLMQLAGAATEDNTLGLAVGSRGGGNVPGVACDLSSECDSPSFQSES
ncbi:hypothetical protein R1sor_016300 [Riccia sorocarpa]|uniref:Uncharacterized protein n=1 Tax=Riccia sorocarpa TaxID=122646 RepID=A0ABD3HGL8_9MARC